MIKSQEEADRENKRLPAKKNVTKVLGITWSKLKHIVMKGDKNTA